MAGNGRVEADMIVLLSFVQSDNYFRMRLGCGTSGFGAGATAERKPDAHAVAAGEDRNQRMACIRSAPQAVDGRLKSRLDAPSQPV
jgi:hypothetical protein